MTSMVLLPGRHSPEAKSVRDSEIANGRRYSEAIAREGGVAPTVPPLEPILSHVLWRSAQGYWGDSSRNTRRI